MNFNLPDNNKCRVFFQGLATTILKFYHSNLRVTTLNANTDLTWLPVISI